MKNHLLWCEVCRKSYYSDEPCNCGEDQPDPMDTAHAQQEEEILDRAKDERP